MDRLGIGVHEGADVNAPNSLTSPATRKPARRQTSVDLPMRPEPSRGRIGAKLP